MLHTHIAIIYNDDIRVIDNIYIYIYIYNYIYICMHNIFAYRLIGILG